MTTIADIYTYLDYTAPFDTALPYDNCGILIGSGEDPVARCLICLDVTDEIAEEAASYGAELIISHHPVIFHGLKRISKHSMLTKLIQNGIAVISAHTNLDMASDGVNYLLAEICGLDTANLKELPSLKEDQKEDGFGLVGTLPQSMSPRDYARFVKIALGADCIKYVDGGRPVQTVAVSCGSGGFLLKHVLADGEIDALVTAELKHHEYILARSAGLTILDAGHFETEKHIVDALNQRLSSRFPEVNFLCAAQNRNPVSYL